VEDEVKRSVTFRVAVPVLAAVVLLAVFSVRAAPIVRGAYGISLDAAHANGFNTVTCSPDRACLDAAQAAGLKAVVWEGSYNEAVPCGFDRSDQTIVDDMHSIAGHPAVEAWQISDEPDYALAGSCANAVQQHRARTALIHVYDSRPTYTVISTWDGKNAYPYAPWTGATDIMGLDVYPCKRSSSEPVGTSHCDFSMIDNAVAAASSAHVSHYWAVMQAFGACFSDGNCYALPTRDQLADQFERWEHSSMEGYFLYDWTQQASWMIQWCSQESYCQQQVAASNAANIVTPQPTSAPPPSPAPTPKPTATGTRLLCPWLCIHL